MATGAAQQSPLNRSQGSRAVRRCRRRSPWVAVVVFAMLCVAACSNTESSTGRGDPCTGLVDDAASAREIPQQLVLFDRALMVCGSPEEFEAAMSAHRGAIGLEAIDFALGRCSSPGDERLAQSALCRSLVPTTTVVPEAPLPDDETYVGVTLDGREIEITSADVEFIDGRPAPIVAMVDLALEDGCDAVRAEYRQWSSQAGGDDRASVYAQHALNTLRFFECRLS